jgi:transcription elongation factor/antiterminator RfaH
LLFGVSAKSKKKITLRALCDSAVKRKNPMQRWYVIQTKPKKEEAAVFHLEHESIEVFFPKMEAASIVYGKSRKVIKALFPNYIFAHFDPFVSYRLVRWSSGVSRVLGFEDGPAPVDDQVIEIIKRRVDKNCVARKALHFKAKDRIRIRTGPLKDLMGIFEHWGSEEGRVKVLLNLLNYDARVELHYSQVEKI